VSNHIAQITSTSPETGRMAGDARDAAVDLSQQAETLKREVDAFIISVKADGIVQLRHNRRHSGAARQG
jgi:hypothetical protein